MQATGRNPDGDTLKPRLSDVNRKTLIGSAMDAQSKKLDAATDRLQRVTASVGQDNDSKGRK